MKTNMQRFVLSFTVIALFAVSALAQATRYNPTGAVVAQANPTPTPKPTPTPAPANASFIVAPSQSGNTGGGNVKITIPQQTVEGTFLGGAPAQAGNKGGILSPEVVSKVMDDAAAKGRSAGANAGASAGRASAEEFFNTNVKDKQDKHETTLFGDNAGKPGLVKEVEGMKDLVFGTPEKDANGQLKNPGISVLTESMKRLYNDTVPEISNLNWHKNALWFCVLVLTACVVILFVRGGRGRNNSSNSENEGESGSSGNGKNPPPSTTPGSPLRLGVTKPANAPAPEPTPAPTPKPEPKPDHQVNNRVDRNQDRIPDRKLTEAEQKLFDGAVNTWDRYQGDDKSAENARYGLYRRIIENKDGHNDRIAGAIRRAEEDAKPKTPSKVPPQPPAPKTPEATAPEVAQPTNEAEAKDGDVNTIATPSPNAQAKAASSGTDA